MPRFVIIGAGPCGLGAAWAFERAGCSDWVVLERETYAGGLAASFRDGSGFTWDIGGHVLFSHYAEFSSAVADVMGGDMIDHERAAFVRFRGRWVPYPFQYHLHHLDVDDCVRCLSDLARVPAQPDRSSFGAWVRSVFGAGLSELFMEPYNRKVWSWPLENMSAGWMAERVATLDFKRALRNAVARTDERPWGPNSRFAFPKSGGTGEIFRRMAGRLGDRIRFGETVASLDTRGRAVRTSSGARFAYEGVVSTAPVHEAVAMAPAAPDAVREAAAGLGRNSLLIVGLGYRRATVHGRCWMYFPDAAMPAYRVTNFGHYAAANVPGGSDDLHASWLCETSFPEGGAGRADVEPVLRGLEAGLAEAGLTAAGDKPCSVWSTVVANGYPVPTLDRDRRLAVVQGWLESCGVLSRGRFGAWRYEVGNMDHSFMMGWEAAMRLLRGDPERVFAQP